MKKKVLVFLFSVLLVVTCINFSSAISVVYKDNYLPHETLIAKISGDIRENINAGDISFYRGYTEVPINYDIANINGTYYLYALLPETEGNYSFVLKNVTYVQSKVTKKETLENNFTISGNATLQVSPAFVIASKSFSVYLENFGESGEFQAEFFSQKYPVTILHNDASTVSFSLPKNEDFGYITIYQGSSKLYEIPVKIVNPQISSNISASQFMFKNNGMNASLKINDEWKFTLQLYNYAQMDITNVQLKVVGLEDYVSLDQKTVSIFSGTPALINITVKSNEIGTKTGYIEADYNGLTANFTFNFNFTTNTTTVPISDSNSPSCKTICSSNNNCSVATYSIGVAECCPGICEVSGDNNGGGSSGLLTGLIIIVVVLLIGAGIFYFVKKKGKGVSSKDIVKEQSNKYEHILEGKK